jgi:hypothetical protein
MAALIVGGDYVEPLRREIVAHGIERVEHWDGRKPGHLTKTIPAGTRLVVVLVDYIGHQLQLGLKRQAGRHGVPLLFCRRSANDLRSKLDRLHGRDARRRT